MDTTVEMTLDVLEKETRNLLDAINPRKPKPKFISRQASMSTSNDFSKTKTSRFKRTRSRRSSSLMADKTFDLYNMKMTNNKVTVEVLDLDSPDHSPRQKLTKKQAKLMDDMEVQLEDQRRARTAELKFRTQDFKVEHIRVLSRADLFVPGPGVTVDDIAMEKTRLVSLENSARSMSLTRRQETTDQLQVLQQHEAATRVQASFRAHVGRKKFMLIRRLKDISESDGDWIEVRDKQNGDVWYYNKVSGVSQWDRPHELADKLSMRSAVKRLPHNDEAIPSKASRLQVQSPHKLPALDRSAKGGGLSAVRYAAEQVSVSLQREADEAAAAEAQATTEVNGLLGLTSIHPSDALLAPDGYFKRPQLRDTIKGALTETRFDSVSALLAEMDFPESRADAAPSVRPRTMPSMRRTDASKKRFVSVLAQDRVKRSSTSDGRIAVEKPTTAHSVRELTLREVEHPGLETEDEPVDTPVTMCFGCWSSRQGQSCSAHAGPGKKKASETMLLCRNWELGVLRRRYRSEEIQEVFLQRAASLKYDIKRKKFLTVVEQRHPVYRTLNTLVARCNAKSMLWMKAAHWASSLVDLMHSGHVNTPKAIQLGELKRMRASEANFDMVSRYKRRVRSRFPLAPVTGLSWSERTGEEVVLMTHYDASTAAEVEIIHIVPYAVPVKLFEPRQYELALPRTIPMPRASTIPLESSHASIRNVHMKETDYAAWFEVMASSIARDAMHLASEQIKAVTPIAGVEALRRMKEPPVSTIQFATLGRKPRPEMKDVGGLPAELIISQLVTTFVPPQYGSLVVLEKTSVGPAHSSEVSIAFATLSIDPVTQQYILRPLDHIVNVRKPPTITVTTLRGADDKYHYGHNRPEQTAEQESKGFRTTEVTLALAVPIATDPQTFVPADDIASLNDPKANRAVTSKVDGLYPFCEPSTRDNSTLDFYHLLLEGSCSPSKPQVFTAITVQEPGDFFTNMRTDLPLGHLLVSVYRSWAFTQRDVYEEFKTDDGVPYWYHRRTGQTFWERPQYVEEKGSPLTGAVALDEKHAEEPTLGHASQEGTVRRVDQGQFRKQILSKHETEEEATKRRSLVAASLSAAKESGVFNAASRTSAVDTPQVARIAIAEVPPLEIRVVQSEAKKVKFIEEQGVAAAPTAVTTALKPAAQTSQAEAATANNEEMLSTITKSIEQLMAMKAFDKASPQDMIKLGLGMGMAILQSGGIKAEPAELEPKSSTPAMAAFPYLQEGHEPPTHIPKKFPIGEAVAQKNSSLHVGLDHKEEAEAVKGAAEQSAVAMTTLERAQEIRLHQADTMSLSSQGDDYLAPANADEAVKKTIPLLVYPELSTTNPGGALPEVITHSVAGVGESFSKLGDDSSQFLKNSDMKLRRLALPLPTGFYEAIVSKHIAQQATPYLPQVPNLPQTHTVGRVKPRSAAGDWLLLNFDPWSAGKAPLSNMFIENLSTQAGKLFEGGEEEATRELEAIREEVTRDAFIRVDDKEGIEQIRAVTTKSHILAADFKKLCSLARHGKFEEVENLVNQSDWEVPINYVDDQGRTLLHIVAQNGNKRLTKLCLRRGININAQTLTGQTALHYAFGFGFADLGEYLISKGADDSIRNSDGLTCYEGLESMHISYL